jgi:tRNA(Met) C34 N-acetyltransferase TmcA
MTHTIAMANSQPRFIETLVEDIIGKYQTVLRDNNLTPNTSQIVLNTLHNDGLSAAVSKYLGMNKHRYEDWRQKHTEVPYNEVTKNLGTAFWAGEGAYATLHTILTGKPSTGYYAPLWTGEGW